MAAAAPRGTGIGKGAAMQNEEQQLDLPYSAVGELYIDWRRRNKEGQIETGFTWATGFPIGDGTFIATAAHLVCGDGMIEAKVQYITGSQSIPAQWIYGSQSFCGAKGAPAVYDVAIVKLPQAVPHAQTLKPVSGTLNNKQCHVVGYINRVLRLRDITVAQWPLENETLGGPLKYELGQTQRGMSGGPVFDRADGRVIGIVSGDNNVWGLSAPLITGSQVAGYDFLNEVMRANRPPSIF
jgi:hypothetical protein